MRQRPQRHLKKNTLAHLTARWRPQRQPTRNPFACGGDYWEVVAGILARSGFHLCDIATPLHARTRDHLVTHIPCSHLTSFRTMPADLSTTNHVPGRLLLLKRGNESQLTYSLKWAAWQWLHEYAGCRVIAFEVQLEGPGGRVSDVVGLGPENRVHIIEVKASRSDASRDDKTRPDAEKLGRKTASLDEAVDLAAGVLEAAARLARERFGDTWRNDPACAKAETDHRAALNNRGSHSRRIATLSTKFHDPAYLRAADCHYIMAPAKLLKPSTLPPFWGLLDERPALIVEAPVKQVRKATAHVLRAIARANTRDLALARNRAEAVSFPEAASRPETVQRPTGWTL